MSHDLRADQANEAKAREGTLSLPAGAAAKPASFNRPRTNTNAASRPAPKQFVAKGHDAILKDVQDSKGRIAVQLMSSPDEVHGVLAARDKFTITILLDSGVRRTIYKHAIESFEPAQVSK